MLRNWAKLRWGLPGFVTPRNEAPVTVPPMGIPRRSSHELQGNSKAWISTSEKSMDLAVPNPAWSQEMVSQFNRYMEMTKDSSWQKMPSFRSFSDHFPAPAEGLQKEELQKQNYRLFLRSIGGEGEGFEYAMFRNPSEKRMAAVFQIGPYLEGPPGLAQGGAIATILESTLALNTLYVNRRVLVANLSITYKSPMALGSVVLVDARLDKIEGRKILASGEIRSVDEQTLHAEATGLFIEMVPQSSL